MKIIIRILLILAFLALMLFIPAIPVLSAPVIPDAQPEMTSLSLFEVISGLISPILGVSITWEWYSYLALGILVAIMMAVAILITFVRI